MSRLQIAGALAASMTLVTAAAAAQDRPARFAVGAGTGLSMFHGDLDFNAAGWEVAARGTPARHLTVEAFGSTWRHSSESVQIGLPVQGPEGFIGTVGRLSQHTRHQTHAFGVSLMPTFSTGRVTVTAGGGASVMFFQRRFDQQFEDCVPSSMTCGSFSNAHTASDLGVHAVASVDVRLASHVVAFGQYRVIVPLRDPGSGHGAVVAGMRLAVY
jgi:hypothetical protein